MKASQTANGRARTVLVFGEGQSAKVAVSTVIARVRRQGGRERLRMVGPVTFDPAVRTHLSQTVLAATEQITTALGLPRRHFDVSVVNLSAASACDVGVTIVGYSADAAVFVGLLSAACRIPIPQDVAVTGHIASADGDMRAVRSIPAKLRTAASDQNIRRFLLPPADTDHSLPLMSPEENDRIAQAIASARDQIHVMEVSHVGELLQAVFSDEAVVWGSLQGGFFGAEADPGSDDRPVDQAVRVLAEDLDGRCWSVLERYLFAAHGEQAKRLLTAWARHHIRKKEYPSGFGERMLQLIRSVPPATRRMKLTFPLLSMDHALRLGRYASPTDHQDVQYLLDAVAGRHFARTPGPATVTTPEADADTQAYSAVDTVLSQISADVLARTIGLPIDTGRAGYAMDEVLIDSHEAFCDAIAAFYLALLRHSGSVTASVDDHAVAAEALALLERAFEKRGGIDAAWAEARHGTQGGMRFVLDLLTEQFKAEQQTKCVTRVLKEALDPLDWSARVDFIKALLTRIGPEIPDEVREAPPERFARHHEPIAQTYVHSLDQFKHLLRRL